MNLDELEQALENLKAEVKEAKRQPHMDMGELKETLVTRITSVIDDAFIEAEVWGNHQPGLKFPLKVTKPPKRKYKKKNKKRKKKHNFAPRGVRARQNNYIVKLIRGGNELLSEIVNETGMYRAMVWGRLNTLVRQGKIVRVRVPMDALIASKYFERMNRKYLTRAEKQGYFHIYKIKPKE